MGRLNMKDLRILNENTQIKSHIYDVIGVSSFLEITGFTEGTLIRYLQYSNFDNLGEKTKKTLLEALGDYKPYTDEEQIELLLNEIDHNQELYKGDYEFFNRLTELVNQYDNEQIKIKAEILKIANMAFDNQTAAIIAYKNLIERVKGGIYYIDVLRELAYTYYLTNQHEDCDSVLKIAKKEIKYLNVSKNEEARIYHLSGLNNYASNDKVKAKVDYKKANTLYEADYNKCITQIMIGMCYKDNSNMKAHNQLLKALDIANRVNDPYLLLMCYNNLFDLRIETEGYAHIYMKKSIDHSENCKVMISRKVALNNRIRYLMRYNGDVEEIKMELYKNELVAEMSKADLVESSRMLIREISKSINKDVYLLSLLDGIIELYMIDNSKLVKEKLKWFYGHVVLLFNENLRGMANED